MSNLTFPSAALVAVKANETNVVTYYLHVVCVFPDSYYENDGYEPIPATWLPVDGALEITLKVKKNETISQWFYAHSPVNHIVEIGTSIPWTSTMEKIRVVVKDTDGTIGTAIVVKGSVNSQDEPSEDARPVPEALFHS